MPFDNGGNAFPFTGGFAVSEGMALRDYFAAKALAGWLASWPDGQVSVAPHTIAAFAYEIADAMLTHRHRTTAPDESP